MGSRKLGAVMLENAAKFIHKNIKVNIMIGKGTMFR